MAANTSISHMLSGKAAGITSVQNSAQPGGGVTLRIRGEASTGAGNEPLYIIDGFPVGGSQVEPAADNRYSDFGSRNPLNSINPNDIESIEILKMLLPRLFTEQELRTVLSSLRLKGTRGKTRCQLQRKLWRPTNCQQDGNDDGRRIHDRSQQIRQRAMAL